MNVDVTMAAMATVVKELNRPEEGSLQQIGHHYEERKVFCVTDSLRFFAVVVNVTVTITVVLVFAVV